MMNFLKIFRCNKSIILSENLFIWVSGLHNDQPLTRNVISRYVGTQRRYISCESDPSNLANNKWGNSVSGSIFTGKQRYFYLTGGEHNPVGCKRFAFLVVRTCQDTSEVHWLDKVLCKKTFLTFQKQNVLSQRLVEFTSGFPTKNNSSLRAKKLSLSH